MLLPPVVQRSWFRFALARSLGRLLSVRCIPGSEHRPLVLLPAFGGRKTRAAVRERRGAHVHELRTLASSFAPLCHATTTRASLHAPAALRTVPCVPNAAAVWVKGVFSYDAVKAVHLFSGSWSLSRRVPYRLAHALNGDTATGSPCQEVSVISAFLVLFRVCHPLNDRFQSFTSTVVLLCF